MKEIERNSGVQSESAVLVGVFLSDQPNDDEILSELAGLAETAGAEVVGRLTQRRNAPGRSHNRAIHTPKLFVDVS